MNDAKASKKTTSKAAGKTAKATGTGTTTGKAKDNVLSFPEINENQVYRVDVSGSPIRITDRESAIADSLVGGAFTRETLETMLKDNEVIFSDDFYYSTNRKALAKWEMADPNEVVAPVAETPATAPALEPEPEQPEQPTLPETAPEPEPKAEPKPQTDKKAPVEDVTEGTVVYHDGRKTFGEIKVEGESTRVHFLDEGRKKSAAYKSNLWRLATEKETEAFRNPVETAIEKKKDDKPVVEELPPLTKSEKQELATREKAIAEAKEQADSAPWIMASNLAEIAEKKLYRDTVNPETNKKVTLKEYAFVRFGITREYAQNLAQLGKLQNFLDDGVEHSDQMQMSINAGNQLARGLNKLAKGLTAGELTGMDPLRPVVAAVGEILYDMAPKDSEGNAEITPRLVDATLGVLKDIVKSGTVTIEGKQMKVAEAQEKGLLNIGAQSEILTRASEGILTQREIIRSEVKKANDEANKAAAPRPAGRPAGTTKDVIYYSGTIPRLVVGCEKHGATAIESIGTGRIQTACQCRWWIDQDTGALVCFEVEGKSVVAATQAAA